MLHCSVFGCSATTENEPNRSFHVFPANAKLRKAWIDRVRRKDFQPGSSSRVCSYHFAGDDYGRKRLSDRPSEFQRRVLKRGAIPAWNLRGEVDERLPVRTTNTSRLAGVSALSTPAKSAGAVSVYANDESKDIDNNNANAVSVSVDVESQKIDNNNAKILEDLKIQLSKALYAATHLAQKTWMYEYLDEVDIKSFTGLEKELFDVVVAVTERFQPLQYWSGKSVNSISSSNQLLILLLKMKYDLPNSLIARQYDVSSTTIQNIFVIYLYAIHEIFFTGCMDRVPSIEKNSCSMPDSFDNIRNCRMIIDCTEFLIETPKSDLGAASVSYSNYKKRLTA